MTTYTVNACYQATIWKPVEIEAASAAEAIARAQDYVENVYPHFWGDNTRTDVESGGEHWFEIVGGPETFDTREQKA